MEQLQRQKLHKRRWLYVVAAIILVLGLVAGWMYLKTPDGYLSVTPSDLIYLTWSVDSSTNLIDGAWYLDEVTNGQTTQFSGPLEGSVNPPAPNAPNSTSINVDFGNGTQGSGVIEGNAFQARVLYFAMQSSNNVQSVVTFRGVKEGAYQQALQTFLAQYPLA